MFFLTSCVSRKELAYLNNLTPSEESTIFPMEKPEYKIQPRDILYITIKAMTFNGRVEDFLSPSTGSGGSQYTISEAGQYLYGYDIDNNGDILLPVIGKLNIAGRTLGEARSIIQTSANNHFNNTIVECKILSFKFTVIGEVRAPGTYINYNNYLTVLEAIGRSGGLTDFGNRKNILVVRPVDNGTKTFHLNLQDKSILSNEAFFLLPNDVVIVEPESKKIFNLNLPTIAFILTSVTSVVTTSLLLVNYFK